MAWTSEPPFGPKENESRWVHTGGGYVTIARWTEGAWWTGDSHPIPESAMASIEFWDEPLIPPSADDGGERLRASKNLQQAGGEPGAVQRNPAPEAT